MDLMEQGEWKGREGKKCVALNALTPRAAAVLAGPRRPSGALATETVRRVTTGTLGAPWILAKLNSIFTLFSFFFPLSSFLLSFLFSIYHSNWRTFQELGCGGGVPARPPKRLARNCDCKRVLGGALC